VPTHVALLRGINLGPHKRVAMPALRTLVGSLGHTDVATYIASGNVVFTAADAAPGPNLEKAIATEGLRSRMVLQVHDELVLEVAEGERERLEALVRREMAGAADLSVALEVSVGFGPSWDAAAH